MTKSLDQIRSNAGGKVGVRRSPRGRRAGQSPPTGSDQMNEAQRVFVQLMVQGENYAVAAERMSSGEFDYVLGVDYSITPSALAKWAKRPHIAAQIQQMQSEKIQTIAQIEIKQTETILPGVKNRLLDLLPQAVDALEDVLKDGSKKGSFARLQAAFKVIELNMGQITTTETVGTARQTSTTGLSDDTFSKLKEQLFGRVIYGAAGPTRPMPQELAAGSGESIDLVEVQADVQADVEVQPQPDDT
jgi:hypothetical protein